MFDLDETTNEWVLSGEMSNGGTGHTGVVVKVAWAHTEFGTLLASCSEDHSVIVWKEGTTHGPYSLTRADHHVLMADSVDHSWSRAIDLVCRISASCKHPARSISARVQGGCEGWSARRQICTASYGPPTGQCAHDTGCTVTHCALDRLLDPRTE